MSKYHAKKTVVDGMLFDSAKEAGRYRQLKLMARAGQIANLRRQVKYELVPAQYIDGRCVERAVTYTSDFEYDELVPLRVKTVLADARARTMGEHIVEDVKGVRTEAYKIKRKLMLERYGIRIRET